MAIFDQKTAAKKDTAPFNSDLPPFQAPPAAGNDPGSQASTPRAQGIPAKESLIAGDLTIESGAKLTGGVRAKRVIIAGELEGNIEGAAQVELQQGGVLVGDVKAGSLTVASGARMRGQADFGWEEKSSAGGKANVEPRPVA